MPMTDAYGLVDGAVSELLAEGLRPDEIRELVERVLDGFGEEPEPPGPQIEDLADEAFEREGDR